MQTVPNVWWRGFERCLSSSRRAKPSRAWQEKANFGGPLRWVSSCSRNLPSSPSWYHLRWGRPWERLWTGWALLCAASWQTQSCATLIADPNSLPSLSCHRINRLRRTISLVWDGSVVSKGMRPLNHCCENIVRLRCSHVNIFHKKKAVCDVFQTC